MKKTVSDEDFRLANENKDNISVMRSVTNMYAGLIPAEDLHCCALTGLWRCLGYHEDCHGQKFTTSLWRFTDWECKRDLAKRKKQKNLPGIQSIIDFDVAMPKQNPDAIYIKEYIELLPKKYKEIINEYYFENRTMEEIGKIHNYSKEAARQKIRKALSKLREMYYGVS